MFSALFYRHSNCKYIQYPNLNSIFVPVICAHHLLWPFYIVHFPGMIFFISKMHMILFLCIVDRSEPGLPLNFSHFFICECYFSCIFLFRLYNVEIQPTKIRHLHLLIASIKGNIRVFRCVIASVKSLVIYLRLALFLLICSIKML